MLGISEFPYENSTRLIFLILIYRIGEGGPKKLSSSSKFQRYWVAALRFKTTPGYLSFETLTVNI